MFKKSKHWLAAPVFAAICLTSATSHGMVMPNQGGDSTAVPKEKCFFGSPDENQGYFLFNPRKHPYVKRWSMEVFTLHFAPNGAPDKKIVYRHGTEDTYIKLPKEYMMPDFPIQVIISGFDDANTIIVQDEWAPAQYNRFIGVEECYSTCNGRTYAYSIRINDQIDLEQNGGESTGHHSFAFTGASGYHNPQDGILVPFKMGIQENAYMNFCSNSNGIMWNDNDYLSENKPAHFGGNNHNWSCEKLREENLMIKIENVTPQHKLYTSDMTLIGSGTVWAVNKSLGFWKPDAGKFTDWKIQDAGSVCGTLTSQFTGNPQAMMNALNQLSSTDPIFTLSQQLTCDGLWSKGASGTPVGGSYWFPQVVWNGWSDGLADINNGDGGSIIFDVLDYVSNELALFAPNTTGVPWWPSDSILDVQIYQWNIDDREKDGNPIWHASKNNLFDADGVPVSTAVTLDPGLYSLTVIHELGALPLIFEVDEKTEFAFPIANYLSVNIFPVPLNDDTALSIELKAGATLQADYTIMNDQGHVLHSSHIRMKQNEDRLLKVSSDNLPKGFLYHKFVFDDGSEINVTTMRN